MIEHKGLLVKEARHARGLRQVDVEQMTGICPSILSAIENGRYGIGRRWAALLGLALDIEPGDLITFPDVELKDTNT